MATIDIRLGDSRDVLKTLADNSIDSVVTDPPYALVSIGKRFGAENAAPAKAGKSGAYQRASAGFMGKTWDTGETAFAVEFWAEVMRVLKPGGHVIAFSGTRTYHRLAVAIEDAGFEIRDMVAWLYGSGFPKSHDVSKGIDKAAGVEFTASPASGVGFMGPDGPGGYNVTKNQLTRSGEMTTAARQWQGWGTALKPALEPIVLARKPLGTGGANVLDNVERAIRSAGYEGEIVWKPEPANAAANSEPRTTLSSTQQPPAAETSADHADAFETASDARQTESGSGPKVGNGGPKTPSAVGKTLEPQTPGSDVKSSPLTAGAASVAESENKPSSPSTTSTVAEHSTARASTAKSMPNCDGAASPETAIDSYAGIATGLSGSMALVRISRDKSGAFLWPAGLPKSVLSTSLTVAANVLAHGTGALNIDASRIAHNEECRMMAPSQANIDNPSEKHRQAGRRSEVLELKPGGRWPANTLHDGSEEVIAAFPTDEFGSNPSRFFYTAKADATERLGTKHPTVKPTDLMAYLVRLVTPPGGTVLDPFAGSGSTGVACVFEGFNAVLIEREPEYFADIERRIEWAKGDGKLTASQIRRPISKPAIDGDLFPEAGA